MGLSLSPSVLDDDAYLALQEAARSETVCSFDESECRRLPVEWTMPG
jgi:hypothetical protein